MPTASKRYRDCDIKTELQSDRNPQVVKKIDKQTDTAAYRDRQVDYQASSIW